MEEYRKILKKVGIALLVVGLIDIGIMAYCITNKINYSSSFNIFAVIAGIYLIKGGLKTAGYVAFFGAFMLTGFTGLLFMVPLMEPLDLRIIKFNLNPLSTILAFAIVPIVIGFIYWVYREVTSEPVLTAKKEAGLKHKKPELAFVLGAMLVVVISFVIYSLNYGESANAAKLKAAEIYGSEYSYHVTSMSSAGNYGNATLTAYNEIEIKSVKVEWEN